VQAVPVVKACNGSEKDDVRIDLAGGQEVLRELTLLALLVQKSTNTDAAHAGGRGGGGNRSVTYVCASS
jgi:GTPase involved in cell partitioning and DNA repair